MPKLPVFGITFGIFAKTTHFWHHFWRFINGFMLSFCPIPPFLPAKTAIFKTYYVPAFFIYPAHQIFTYPAPLLRGTLFFSSFYLCCFHLLWIRHAFHPPNRSFFFFFLRTAPSGAHRLRIRSLLPLLSTNGKSGFPPPPRRPTPLLYRFVCHRVGCETGSTVCDRLWIRSCFRPVHVSFFHGSFLWFFLLFPLFPGADIAGKPL